MSRTTLTPTRRPPPTGLQVRPSDRHIDDLPRHAPDIIPIRPRRAVIAIETAAEPPTRVLDAGDDDSEALEYSTELL